MKNASGWKLYSTCILMIFIGIAFGYKGYMNENTAYVIIGILLVIYGILRFILFHYLTKDLDDIDE